MENQLTLQEPKVLVRKKQVVITSLQLANDFGKLHKDVLKAIRELDSSTDFIERNFTPYHYISKLNKNATRKLPMYYITRDGFTFLAMGFTGKAASKFKEGYINAFNAMEQKLKDIKQKGLVSITLFNEQKRLAIYWKDVADRKVESLKPKTLYLLTDEYYNHIMDTVGRWIYCENTRSMDPRYRDKRLVERLEAIRLIHCDNKREVPFPVSLHPIKF